MGDVVSTCVTSGVAPGLSFSAASVTAPAGTATRTSPSAVAVTSKVYVDSEPAKSLSVPLVSTTSSESKPVTGSSQVTVTGMTGSFVGSSAVVEMVAAGPEVS